jgi:hypothetical protein
VRCEFRGDGLKRAPISREYVTALESRIGVLEGFLTKLKPSDSVEYDELNNLFDFEVYQSPESLSPGTESHGSQAQDRAGTQWRLGHEYDGMALILRTVTFFSRVTDPSVFSIDEISDTKQPP